VGAEELLFCTAFIGVGYSGILYEFKRILFTINSKVTIGYSHQPVSVKY
jgi:hypothetical protein